MKRIALLFAATAVLASCMKENSLAPEQTNDNLVTIKAVAAETKTVLDGTDVVWENNDAIKVVFNSEDKIYTSVFTSYLEKGMDILYISCSSALSGSIGLANLIAQELGESYPDSKIICICNISF